MWESKSHLVIARPSWIPPDSIEGVKEKRVFFAEKGQIIRDSEIYCC